MMTSLSMSKEFISKKNYETKVWGMCQFEDIRVLKLFFTYFITSK